VYINRLSRIDAALIENAQARIGRSIQATATAPPPQQRQLRDFGQGTREIRLPIGQIAFAAGGTFQMPNGGPIPKSGFLSSIYYTFIGNVTVGTAGTSGTPTLYNFLQNISLTANYGYQYRNFDGETLRLFNLLNEPNGVLDPFSSANPAYKNYDPTSATAQAVQFSLTDNIGLNEGINYQDFLVSTQTLDSDLILQVTFGQITAPRANTEVITAVSGTLYADGLWFSVPDRSVFAVPEIRYVQQISSGDSGLGTGIAAGAPNVVNLTPVQGPRYLQLAIKVTANGVPDPANSATAIQSFELRANNAESLFIQSAVRTIMRQTEYFGRALPAGWFVFDFLHDVNLLNAKGPFGRNIVSTQLYSTLWLIVTTLGGLAVPASFKIAKRIAAPIQA
jgi:hypothetical protein